MPSPRQSDASDSDVEAEWWNKKLMRAEVVEMDGEGVPLASSDADCGVFDSRAETDEYVREIVLLEFRTRGLSAVGPEFGQGGTCPTG